MYDDEKARNSANVINEIQNTAERRLEQCMAEFDSLQKQAETLEMHRRTLHSEMGTLKRVLESSRNEGEKDVDLSRVSRAGSSGDYSSTTWPG